jgi:hypothetical protein
MNLTPEPTPTGEIWHLNPSGLRSSSGGYQVVNVFLSGLFSSLYRFFLHILGFFRVPFGFFLVSGFFRFLSFFWISGFFWFLLVILGFRFFRLSDAPAGEKRNLNPVLCASGAGSTHGCKNEHQPASIG